MWTRKDFWSGINERTNWESRNDQLNDAWNSKIEWQSEPQFYATDVCRVRRVGIPHI